MRACLLLLVLLRLIGGDAQTATTWEQHIAALTDPRPSIYDPAIESLVRIGEACLDDVAALRSDDDFQVRMRIVTVAAGIGGARAQTLIRDLSRDDQWRVRELAALGLGKTALPGAYERLVELLHDRQGEVRRAAARGLDDVGDPRALDELALYGDERDVAVRDAMRAHLGELCARPHVVPALAQRLGAQRGEPLYALLDASGLVGDPRLSEALAAHLRGTDLRAATLAAHSLAADGDSRALEALTQAAAHGYRDLAETAASTLRTLTGHPAGVGAAWQLWWRDHAASIAALAERDRFIADLHDPQHPVARDDLTRFTPDQLMPLVDGVLGYGASWWPARAYAVLMLDEASRWTQPIAARIDGTAAAEERLALIVLLDQLGDQAALPVFRRLLDQADAVVKHERRQGNKDYNHAERAALQLAIERRQRR